MTHLAWFGRRESALGNGCDRATTLVTETGIGIGRPRSKAVDAPTTRVGNTERVVLMGQTSINESTVDVCILR